MSNSEITPKTFPKVKPRLADFPPHLKDPANFRKIQLAIFEAFSGSCGTHGEVAEWAKCGKCQKAAFQRSLVMQSLGFQSPAHYRAWVKIHTEIRRRVPLRMYDD